MRGEADLAKREAMRMLTRYAFWAGLLVSILAIVVVIWILTLRTGPLLDSYRGDILFTPAEVTAFLAVIVAIPVAGLLGLWIWVVVAKPLSLGIVAGAAICLLVGPITAFGAAIYTNSQPPPGLLRTLDGQCGNVASLAFSPDGTTLISGGVDGSIRVWRLSVGALWTKLQEGVRRLQFENSPVAIVSLTFSPEGTLLASSARILPQQLRVWRTSDWTLLKTLEHPGPITSAAFSPDGALVASRAWDHLVRLWRTSDGTLLRSLEHPEPITSVAFSPDGALVASGARDLVVRLWRTSDGTLIRALEGHIQLGPNTPFDVAFSPDGTQLASGSNDGVRLWQVSDGALLHTLDTQASEVDFWPDGATLASYTLKHVNLWSVQDGKFLRSLTGSTRGGGPLWAFSPDGTVLASGSVRWQISQCPYVNPSLGLWPVQTATNGDKSEKRGP